MKILSDRLNLPPLSPKARETIYRILALLALLSLVLLAASMDSLVLRPGTRMALFDTIGDADDAVLYDLDWDTIVLVAQVFTVIVVTISVIMVMVTPDLRRRLGKYVVQVITILIIYAIALSFTQPLQDEEEELPGSQQPASGMVDMPTELIGGDQTPLEFDPPPAPNPGLVYSIGLILALAVVLLAYWGWRAANQPETRLEAIAKSAMRDLSDGRAWEDTVIQCYAQMSGVVSQRRGVERQAAMTPTEFAQRLVAHGLPAEAIHRLTRLFEKARYGNRTSSTGEAHEAMVCLNDILQAMKGH